MQELHGRLDRWPSLPLEERCALLGDLAVALLAPDGDDGYRDDELGGMFAPPALRTLYSTAGRALERANDPLAPPGPLDGHTHRLFTENQGNFVVDACPEAGDDDPWVDWSVERRKTFPMTSRLSDVLVQYVLSQAVSSPSPVAVGNLRADGVSGVLAAIEGRTTTLACPPWPWPGAPRVTTRFIHGSRLFGVVHDDAKATDRWVFLVAADASAFEFLRPFGRQRWDAWPFDDAE